ncbi:ATP-binding protein [Streptomyces globisporus]|uniref:ATP-binding protein n=1 Tax=Streptomyces globisporus TaxID=1908 RepID=UPI003822A45C
MARDRFELPHNPSSCGMARRRARVLLQRAAVGEDRAESALLVLSELVANAIEHAEPQVTVELTLRAQKGTSGRCLHIRVHDGGCRRPVGDGDRDGTSERDADDVERGRGQTVVAALASACGRYATVRSAVTWAVIDCV